MKTLIQVFTFLVVFTIPQKSYLQDDIDVIDEKVLTCFNNDEPRVLTRCSNHVFKPEDIYCEQRYIGKLDISDASKSLVAEYCLDVGDEIRFKNFSDSTTRTFNVVKKFYGYTTQKNGTSISCIDDSTKVIMGCADIQLINVVLECKEVDLKFYINLSKFVFAPSDEKRDRFSERLTIHRFNKKGNKIFDLNLVLNRSWDKLLVPRNQTVDVTKSPNGKVLGYTYSSYWSGGKNNIPENFTMNYSTGKGLSFFIDDKDVIWIKE